MSPTYPGAVEFTNDTTTHFHLNGIQKPDWVYQTLSTPYEVLYGQQVGWGSNLRLGHYPSELLEYVASENAKYAELRQALTSPQKLESKSAYLEMQKTMRSPQDLEEDVWSYMARAIMAEHRVKQVLDFVGNKIRKMFEEVEDEEYYDTEGRCLNKAWEKVLQDLGRLREGNTNVRRAMEEIAGMAQK